MHFNVQKNGQCSIRLGILVSRVLCILLTLCLAPQTISEDYCHIMTCAEPSEHVMCKYPKAGPAETCIGYVNKKISHYDKEQMYTILDQINEIRNAVALGGWKGMAGFPPASNMAVMHWDSELEEFAQRLADQCATEEVNDKCRNSAKHKNVSQFILMTNGTVSTFDYEVQVFEQIVMSTLEAIKRKSATKHFVKNAEDTPTEMKLLAQVLWGTSTKFACARSVYEKNAPPPNETLTIFHVCNFADGGSMNGTIYRIGTPCSKCTCSRDYVGLCGSGATDISMFLLIPAALIALYT